MSKLIGMVKAAFTNKAVLWIGGAVIAAVALGLVVRRGAGGGDTTADRATFEVKRGDLEITIHDTGDLQAKDSIKIQPEAEGESTIVELAEEGTRVKKGDVIVKLDATQLEQRIATEEIQVENTRASLVRAQEQKRIQELTNETNLARAKLNLNAAKMERDKYGDVALTAEGFLDTDSYLVYGKYPLFALDGAPESAMGSDSYLVIAPLNKGDAYQQFREAELEISRAETSLQQAETNFKDMDTLLVKGFVTKNEYIQDELAVLEGRRRLESTQLRHFMLRAYTHTKALAEKQSSVRQATDADKQAEFQARSEMRQRESAIKESQSGVESREKNLAKLKDWLSKMTITAPEDGLVLYGEQGGWWDRERIKVGGKVYKGMTLITLPKISNMIAATKVMERDVNKVKIEQKALVTVPALPDLKMNGKLTKIASVASQSRRWWMPSEIRTFDIEVTVDGNDARIKPGMSCEVTLFINTLKDVVYVPVNTVFREGGKDVCYVVEKRKVTPVEVKTGDGSDLYVEIKEGLKGGEQVLLYSAAGPGRTEEATGASTKKAAGVAGEGDKAKDKGDGAEKKAEGTTAEGDRAKGKGSDVEKKTEGTAAPAAEKKDGTGSGDKPAKAVEAKAAVTKEGAADSGKPGGAGK